MGTDYVLSAAIFAENFVDWQLNLYKIDLLVVFSR